MNKKYLSVIVITLALISIVMGQLLYTLYFPMSADVSDGDILRITMYLDPACNFENLNGTNIEWKYQVCGYNYKLFWIKNTGTIPCTLSLIIKDLPSDWALTWNYDNSILYSQDIKETKFDLLIPEGTNGAFNWECWIGAIEYIEPTPSENATMTPYEVEWNIGTLEPDSLFQIFSGVPYNGYEGGGDCASLEVIEDIALTGEFDQTTIGHWNDTTNVWIRTGGANWMFGLKNEETWNVNEGVYAVDFDGNFKVRNDIEKSTDGSLLVLLKEGTKIVGKFRLNYFIDVGQKVEIIKIYASKDAYISESRGSSNYGTARYLYVQTFEDLNKRTLYEFPLIDIPSDVIIVKVTMHLMSGDTVGHFPQNQTFSRIIGLWNENTVTWNNQPDTTSLNEQIIEILHNTGGRHEYFDMTEMVKDSIDTGKFGVMIRFTIEDESIFGNRAIMFYCARNAPFHGWLPYIEVEYIE